MRRTTLLVCALMVAAAGCRDDRAATAAEAGSGPACLPDSLALAGPGAITEAGQRALYAAVAHEVRATHRDTLYLDPRVETVGQGLAFTRRHDSTVVSGLLATAVFAGQCEPAEARPCAVASRGLSVRLSRVLRVPGGDTLFVDVTHQTVWPDTASHPPEGRWERHHLGRRDGCWVVLRSEVRAVL